MAICEDYRASVTIDLEHDRESLAKGQKIVCEFLALWGAEGVIENASIQSPSGEISPITSAATRCHAVITFRKKRPSC